MTSEESLQLAAQCWYEVPDRVMDEQLAVAFAQLLDAHRVEIAALREACSEVLEARPDFIKHLSTADTLASFRERLYPLEPKKMKLAPSPDSARGD